MAGDEHSSTVATAAVPKIAEFTDTLIATASPRRRGMLTSTPSALESALESSAPARQQLTSIEQTRSSDRRASLLSIHKEFRRPPLTKPPKKSRDDDYVEDDTVTVPKTRRRHSPRKVPIRNYAPPPVEEQEVLISSSDEDASRGDDNIVAKEGKRVETNVGGNKDAATEKKSSNTAPPIRKRRIIARKTTATTTGIIAAEKPKRPPNAYGLYNQEHRSIVAAKFPDLSHVGVMAEIARQWGALSVLARAPYVKQAAALETEYDIERKTWEKLQNQREKMDRLPKKRKLVTKNEEKPTGPKVTKKETKKPIKKPSTTTTKEKPIRNEETKKATKSRPQPRLDAPLVRQADGTFPPPPGRPRPGCVWDGVLGLWTAATTDKETPPSSLPYPRRRRRAKSFPTASRSITIVQDSLSSLCAPDDVARAISFSSNKKQRRSRAMQPASENTASASASERRKVAEKTKVSVPEDAVQKFKATVPENAVQKPKASVLEDAVQKPKATVPEDAVQKPKATVPEDAVQKRIAASSPGKPQSGARKGTRTRQKDTKPPKTLEQTGESFQLRLSKSTSRMKADGTFRRPRGAAPNGFRWDQEHGKWVPEIQCDSDDGFVDFSSPSNAAEESISEKDDVPKSLTPDRWAAAKAIFSMAKTPKHVVFAEEQEGKVFLEKHEAENKQQTIQKTALKSIQGGPVQGKSRVVQKSEKSRSPKSKTKQEEKKAVVRKASVTAKQKTEKQFSSKRQLLYPKNPPSLANDKDFRRPPGKSPVGYAWNSKQGRWGKSVHPNIHSKGGSSQRRSDEISQQASPARGRSAKRSSHVSSILKKSSDKLFLSTTPIQNKDGTYVCPRGDTPEGFAWDPRHGRWTELADARVDGRISSPNVTLTDVSTIVASGTPEPRYIACGHCVGCSMTSNCRRCLHCMQILDGPVKLGDPQPQIVCIQRICTAPVLNPKFPGAQAAQLPIARAQSPPVGSPTLNVHRYYDAGSSHVTTSPTGALSIQSSQRMAPAAAPIAMMPAHSFQECAGDSHSVLESLYDDDSIVNDDLSDLNDSSSTSSSERKIPAIMTGAELARELRRADRARSDQLQSDGEE